MKLSAGPEPLTQAPPALEVVNLTKAFAVGKSGRSIVAVNNVSFTIHRGEVLGLVGESGSGKSTIARLISQLYTPSSGSIQISGQPVPQHMKGPALARFRKQVQMIFQDPYASLNPQQPISYILSRPFQIHRLAKGRQVQQQVHQLLNRVGLFPGASYAPKRPHELSGGQRQRVSIARALAVQPSVILADEPTSALDVSIRLDIMNLLLDLRDQEGLAMLFITHDLAGARYMSDRIAVMYAGHLVEMGPADEVIQRPRHPYTQLLKQAAPDPDAHLKQGPVEARGEIPDLKNLPPGCPFAPRCPHARPACSEHLPQMYTVGSGHQVRCILHDPVLKG
ncbi:ABC transporter ATP-binding protein [Deinococcus cellulosilyticus]|uniref:Dipeptide/oligopeptide/nickel ABC transporter ATP-binding protein n=1 Tax=Deinococcus cellulosilyticus (strain DSM 18568 / NBRC 106333 / KACC 11606 / 5516J-15) TaxID=1223518 RepID=A0A511MV10_DEIC1|nr:ABC transporter ATP-binding protein [Deinococcus cellulosilyticus]GEM44423.1 dipeptide/oligopeptide/nickel ABC transporter ATP-binding protein [Deinococcus cellulosilyticus NBRC 106333 = KACC 11606]